MKILFVFIFLISSSASFADCYQRLTSDYSRDSQAFQLSEDTVDYKITRGSEVFAREAVVALKASLGCQAQQVSKALMPANCQEVVPNVPMSRVCYVESEFGYFLVSIDMLENINIVFNRFD